MRAIIALFFLMNHSLAYALQTTPSVMNQGELLRVILGLAAVLIIVLSLAWVVKRLNLTKGLSTSGFKAIGSMILGPKEKILLIQAGEKYLLIGVTAGNIALLQDFGTTLPDAFNSGDKPSFTQIFKSNLGKPK